jgi:Asp-tRNA(Asn)/Glu-tRNA(Gln) amidotransferase A subunit family amidase
MATLRSIRELSILELRAELTSARLSPRDVVQACKARIEERGDTIGAWTALDWEHVDRQLEMLLDQKSEARGPLWGIPLGIKDLFDTEGLPTAYGSEIYAGFQPAADAACVACLQAAGAIVLGKTVTTEFACFKAGKTRNPLNYSRSPGGSSSGSAAAVADYMVPAALGSQTAASVIRPAAFCGIVGFKPTYGRISLAGAKALCNSLDTVGVLARTVADVALLASVLTARSDWTATMTTNPPSIRLARTMDWQRATSAAVGAVENTMEVLMRAGALVTRGETPNAFQILAETHGVIMAYETARELAYERHRHWDRLSTQLRALLEKGERVKSSTYDKALSERDYAVLKLDALFQGADVIASPSALGEAPLFEEGTGDPLMCRAWTLLRLPLITLPCGNGPNGLPLGVQLATRPGEDAKLLAVASWVAAKLSGQSFSR